MTAHDSDGERDDIAEALEEALEEHRKLRTEVREFHAQVDVIVKGFFDLAEQHNRLAPEIKKLADLTGPVWASLLSEQPAEEFEQQVLQLVVQVRRLLLVAGLTSSPGHPTARPADPHDLRAPLSAATVGNVRRSLASDEQILEGSPPVRDLRRLLDAASRLMVKPNSTGGLRVYAHLLVSDDRPVFVFDIEPIGFWGTEGLWRFEEGQPMPLLELLLWIARLCTGDTQEEQ